MTTRMLIASAAALSCVALAACSAGSSQGATSVRKAVLVVGTTGALDTIDPLHAESYAGNSINAALYERLVQFADGNKVVPSLAESFEVGADAKSVSIVLPGDVTFHDGSKLTANDVAYTLDRVKRIGQGVAGLIGAYGSSEVADDTHLTIRLTRPDSSFLGALSKIWIVNKALVEANAGSNDGQAWLQSHDAGSGPYMTGGTSPAKEIVVTRFEKYRKKADGQPESIRFKQIDVSATLRDSVKSGAIDIAANMSGADANMLKSDPNLVVQTVPQLVMTIMWMNVSSGPTASLAVRKALQLAYDYEGGLKGIRLGYGKVANGLAPDAFDCRPELPIAKTDLSEAKRLLDEAGVHNLKLTMRFQPLSSEQTREATLFQSNLKKIGVQLNLQPITFPDWLSSLSSVKTIPTMMLAGDSAQYPSLGTWLSTQYSSSAIGTTNRTGYSNSKVDALIAKGLQSASTDESCAAYREAQSLIAKDAPGVHMYSTFAPLVYRKGLEGLTPDFTVRPIDYSGVRISR
jgi:peptide/nickel transport system substrate-binding protein